GRTIAGTFSADRQIMNSLGSNLHPADLVPSNKMIMKVATYNVNSLRRRLPIVIEWLDKQKPDILCLQETKVQDSEFPLMALMPSGYEISYRGMQRYNGVAILTRTKPESVPAGLDDDGEPDEPRLLHAVVGGITILTTYITPQ